MSDFTIKEGDQSPAIKYQLQDDSGNAVDIQGYNDVRFLMKSTSSGSSLKVDDNTSGNVTVTDAANGKVKYEWQSSDTDTADNYKAEWEVEYSSGDKETFPNHDYIDIHVQRDLG